MKTQNKSVIERIKDKLGLTDDGKIEIFFNKQIKNLERSITTLKKNAENSRFNHDQNAESLREKLEDAQDALELSYEDVSVDQISSNANADAFAPVYWARIDRAEANVQEIEAAIKANEESKEKYDSAVAEKIAIIEVRIASLK